MKVCLEVSAAARAPSFFEHDGPALHIGRDPACEVPLDQTFGSVSWRHTRIDVTTNGLMVSDLGSTNGTYVNEQRIGGPTHLGRGDVIRLGQRGPEIKLASANGGGDTQKLTAGQLAAKAPGVSSVVRRSTEALPLPDGPKSRPPGLVQPESDPLPTLMGAMSPLGQQQVHRPMLARLFGGGLSWRLLVALITIAVLALIVGIVLWRTMLG